MSEYQKCPVCNGRGIVPQGFYMVPEGQDFSSSSTAPETCKTCSGSGIILKPSNDDCNYGFDLAWEYDPFNVGGD